jgi:hypothetical protein
MNYLRKDGVICLMLALERIIPYRQWLVVVLRIVSIKNTIIVLLMCRRMDLRTGSDSPGSRNGGTVAMELHFDVKLKVDIVPTWDGDDSTIG